MKLLPTLAATQCNQSRQSHSAILLLPGPPVPRKTRIKVAANFQSRKLFAASHAKQRLGGVGSDGKLSCFMASRREWSWLAGWRDGLEFRSLPETTTPAKAIQRTSTVSWVAAKEDKQTSNTKDTCWGGKRAKGDFLGKRFYCS